MTIYQRWPSHRFFDTEAEWNLQREIIFLNSTYNLARTYNWKRLQHSHHPLKFPLQSQEHHSKPWWVTFFSSEYDKENIQFHLNSRRQLENLSHVFHLYYTLNPIHWSNFPQWMWICLQQTTRTGKRPELDVSSGQWSTPTSWPVAHGNPQGMTRDTWRRVSLANNAIDFTTK